MPSLSDFPAKGKVIDIRNGPNGPQIAFSPSGTTYTLLLSGSYNGPMKSPVEILIRASGRKVWTVPSGGNFIAPINGTPRTIQGRVKFIQDQTIVVQAGVPVAITLPANDSGIDLSTGAIGIGSRVNAMVMPGVSFELAPATASA